MAESSNQSDGTREFSSARGGASQIPGPGVLLKDRYLIERELGRGGIGVVYLARDERLHGMPVVIKFLLETAANSAWIAKKFMQEAEALTRINHPGVVRVIDRDRSGDGKPFFVMEFIRGNHLRSVFTAEGMDFEYAALLIRQIGGALHAAHSEGVFHRDLKPENIMIEILSSGDEQIKLIDFGIAKVRDSQSGSTTDAGIVAGSLNYIAPEQLTGAAVSAASDIYAFGIIAYEMVTGRRPFNPDSPSQAAAVHQLMLMHQGEQIIPPRQLRPSLPLAAEALILKALTFDDGRRPKDSRQFGEALAAALLTAPSEPLQPTMSAETRAIDPSPSVANRPPATAANVARETRSDKAQAAVGAGRSRRASALTIGVALALVAAGAAVAGLQLFRKSETPSPTTSAATSTSEAAPARVLNYWIMMQKDPKRYPGSKPFLQPGEVVFSVGDRVRFVISSPQTGWLYVFNESPPVPGGASAFNILFPSPTSNDGSAQIGAGQEVQIPARGDGFVFDAEEGTERLWLVWAASPVPEFEGLSRWANPQDKGEIKDTNQAGSLRDFLTNHATPAPETRKDEEKKQTMLAAHADPLVKLINLEHH